MLDLIVNSLRMRPDRIVVGEIRRKAEAEVLFEAMHTGHSVLSTLHADTGTQTVRRLTTPPISLPPSDLDAIHLILVQYRDRRKNIRRTLEICEIAPGAKEEEISTSVIYRWRPRTDSFEMVGEPTKYLKELNLHTGMTKEEICCERLPRLDYKNESMARNDKEGVGFHLLKGTDEKKDQSYFLYQLNHLRITFCNR